MGKLLQFKARQEEDIKNIYWGSIGSLFNEEGVLLCEIKDAVLQTDKNSFRIIPISDYTDLFEKLRYNSHLQTPHAVVVQDDLKLRYSRRYEVESLFDIEKDTVGKVHSYQILDKLSKKKYEDMYFEELLKSVQTQVKEINHTVQNFKPVPKIVLINNQLYGFNIDFIKENIGKYINLLNSIQDNNCNVYVVNDFEDDFNWGLVEPSLGGIERILGL